MRNQKENLSEFLTHGSVEHDGACTIVGGGTSVIPAFTDLMTRKMKMGFLCGVNGLFLNQPCDLIIGLDGTIRKIVQLFWDDFMGMRAPIAMHDEVAEPEAEYTFTNDEAGGRFGNSGLASIYLLAPFFSYMYLVGFDFAPDENGRWHYYDEKMVYERTMKALGNTVDNEGMAKYYEDLRPMWNKLLARVVEKQPRIEITRYDIKTKSWIVER